MQTYLKLQFEAKTNSFTFYIDVGYLPTNKGYPGLDPELLLATTPTVVTLDEDLKAQAEAQDRGADPRPLLSHH